jgi:hypothetical protein
VVGIGFCLFCQIRIFADEKLGKDYFKVNDNELMCKECMEEEMKCEQCGHNRAYCNDCV